MSKKLAIVLVNWNSFELTKDTLESLQQTTYTNYDCIVVDNGSVDGHGLVRLVLNCKGVGHSDPGIHEALIEHDGLLEVLSGDFVLFAMEVISTDHEPTDRMCSVVFDQVMGCIIKLSSQAKVQHTGGVNG